MKKNQILLVSVGIMTLLLTYTLFNVNDLFFVTNHIDSVILPRSNNLIDERSSNSKPPGNGIRMSGNTDNQISKIQELKGSAKFECNYSEHKHFAGNNLVYRLYDQEVLFSAEEAPVPYSAFKGGRGELVFELSQGKPITGRSLGELYIDKGILQFRRRIVITYRRGPVFSFLVDGSSQLKINKLGVALIGEPIQLEYFDSQGNTLDSPMLSYQCSIRLVQEGVLIDSTEFDKMKSVPFQDDWIGLDVAGKPLNLAGQSVRVIWFRFDEVSGKLLKD